MIEKTNIPIQNKLTKKIRYKLNLDGGWWWKSEHDYSGKEIYSENCNGFWYKAEYNAEGKRIYSQNSNGLIVDKR